MRKRIPLVEHFRSVSVSVKRNSFLERALKQILLRLGTPTVAARVHVGTGSWIIVGDDRPRLSRGAEREVAHAIDLVLPVINPKDAKTVSLELARQR